MYTPWSLSQILGVLEHYINGRPPDECVRICDPSNPHLKQLHQVLHCCFCGLHSQGIGTVRHQSDAISPSEESLLWDTGVMGTESLSALLRPAECYFYYNGLNFVSRGGEKHRSLKISQFSLKKTYLTLKTPVNSSAV